MHQVGFGLALGKEMVEVSAELGFILGFGFVLKDDSASGEPMGEGVAGRGELDCGSFRAVGFGAVGAGGLLF